MSEQYAIPHSDVFTKHQSIQGTISDTIEMSDSSTDLQPDEPFNTPYHRSHAGTIGNAEFEAFKRTHPSTFEIPQQESNPHTFEATNLSALDDSHPRTNDSVSYKNAVTCTQCVSHSRTILAAKYRSYEATNL